MHVRSQLRLSSRFAVASALAACGGTSTVPDGSATDPGPIVEIAGTYTAVYRPQSTFCVRTANGLVRCWVTETSEQWTPLQSGATQISAVALTGCARMNDGTAKCWGDLSPAGPRRWLTLDVDIDDVAYVTGGLIGCAVKTNGETWCWNGTVDRGGGAYAIQPPTLAYQQPTRQVLVHDQHRVVLFADGHIVDNDVPVPGATDATSVSAAANNVCWTTSTHAVRCHFDPNQWGSSATQFDVSALDGAASITANYDTICGLFDGRVARCWGDGSHIGTADGGSVYDAAVEPTGLAPVDELAVGHAVSCGRRDGQILCWGAWAESLSGAPTNHQVPVPISFGLP